MSRCPALVAVDPDTRRIIRGALVLEPNGDVTITVPHRLESPNKMLHAHWRARTAEKKAWHARIAMVMCDAADLTTLSAYPRPYDALIERCGFQPVTGRRRVSFERQVPSVRNFIRDRENLVYSVKHVMDQVKTLGFVRDDSMKWIDLEVTQRVSDDGRDWTVIRITVPAGEVQPLHAGGPARTASL